MKYFTNCKTLNELKSEYRRLVMIHHPDRGGDPEIMKQINNDHDERFEQLKAGYNATADDNHKCAETPEEFRDILNVLFTLDGLEIELCGSWLWIGGNTREHKDALKAAGCTWCSKKKLWSWHHPEEKRTYHRGKRSIDEIRAKYGSTTFEKTENSKLNGAA